ncbi:SDR family NAD(P)-dependent oxidoreductase [Lutimonas sp.]|uniref:SDR family NAD(P)-dependent oxidoreductase n=1 Tax=Lutimonas sp. TaxID=1872403 RepID=UPI003D9B9121
MKTHTRNMYVFVLFSMAIIFEFYAQTSTNQKAILVTGASSGIGLKITEVLSSKGYFVYAGARKQEDLDRLNAMKNVQSIQLDVNNWDEINAAVETVKTGNRGLYGLVNNAGVAILAPLIEVEEDELDYIFNVNIYGPYRITKAFAPLIIESKGRIATISSISGILSGSFFGPYSMSKHAMEAFTDALADEMKKFGVSVSAIEPGNYNSKISETFYNRLKAQGFKYDNSLYKKEWEGLMAGFTPDRSRYKNPDEVAAAVEKALFSENPKRRYMVVPREEEGQWTITQIMREMAQLNENQAYKYDREALIKILDQVLAETE